METVYRPLSRTLNSRLKFEAALKGFGYVLKLFDDFLKSVFIESTADFLIWLMTVGRVFTTVTITPDDKFSSIKRLLHCGKSATDCDLIMSIGSVGFSGGNGCE